MDRVLTINAGSSSIKFALYALAGEDDPAVAASGLVEGLGTAPRLKAKAADGASIAQEVLPEGASHASALEALLAALSPVMDGSRVVAVGHRIVHGGSEYPEPVRLDAATLAILDGYVGFAPSHQPHNLKAVRAAMEAFPDAIQVGVFDTAFHQGKAFVEDTYGLPRRLYAEGIRRYGHHGLSYDYIASALPRLAGDILDPRGRIVVCHLGNGASMAALRDGRSVESTMGFSALDGLPMGTRCGRLDPGIILYLVHERGMTVDEIETILYRESGLKGLSGVSNDMRDIAAAGTREAEEAIDYFCAQVRREIGAMATTLGGLDGVVFTGGIGEHAPDVRRRVLEPLSWLGIVLDGEANGASRLRITAAGSPVAALVIPTDEEIVIARACRALLPPR